MSYLLSQDRGNKTILVKKGNLLHYILKHIIVESAVTTAGVNGASLHEGRAWAPSTTGPFPLTVRTRWDGIHIASHPKVIWPIYYLA